MASSDSAGLSQQAVPHCLNLRFQFFVLEHKALYSLCLQSFHHIVLIVVTPPGCLLLVLASEPLGKFLFHYQTLPSLLFFFHDSLIEFTAYRFSSYKG